MIYTPEQVAWIEQQMRILEDRIEKETGRDVTVTINRSTSSLELFAEDVIRLVSDATKCPIILILSSTKKTEIAFARYICWYILDDYFKREKRLLEKIGRLFNRDRSTVAHGLETARDLLKTENEMFKGMFSAVMANLKTQFDEKD